MQKIQLRNIMPTKSNRIGAFYLYTTVMRFRRAEIGIPISEYVRIAEPFYEKLSDGEKRVWKERASELRNSDTGVRYKICEKRFKREGGFKLLEDRNHALQEVIDKCYDLKL
jgi:hypothetical protein